MTTKRLCYGLAAILITAGAAMIGYGTLYYRFAHPALTETQLLLANWEVFAVGVISLAGGYALVMEAEGRNE